MNNITKKLSMKKTFFVTQLENFFTTISSEYQELFNALEIDNQLLIEKNQKQKRDIDNLVKIKDELSQKLQEAKSQIEELENELKHIKSVKSDEQNIELIRKNAILKKQNSSQEVKELKQKISNLQNFIQKGGSAYNQSISNQNSENIVKEISKTLKQ
jgi:uncharacterized protein YlxW (UPF0749 family)